MLQRIQTLYIAIAFALTFLLLYVPMADLDLTGLTSAAGTVLAEKYSYTAVGVKQYLTDPNFNGAVSGYYSHSVALMILVILILLIDVLIVVLYKKRILQMRICIFNIMMNLGIYALFFLFVMTTSTGITSSLGVSTPMNYHLPLTFPLINCVLTYLAFRAIQKDEALVRSLDRIR